LNIFLWGMCSLCFRQYLVVDCYIPHGNIFQSWTRKFFCPWKLNFIERKLIPDIRDICNSVSVNIFPNPFHKNEIIQT
jgi:hypothetical protein